MTENHVQHPRAWLAAIILAVAVMIAAADKMLPALLMEPIKHAMDLSDTQIGLLTGFTFAISMALAALPLAWLADRYDRTLLLAIAIGFWCLLTVASGFAHDFTTLFICRLGVGVGEAALYPAALSLIADLFPLKRVARASAMLAYAGAMGSFTAMAGGGALFEHFHAAAIADTLPLAPEDAWRWTTITFGATGLIVALLVATILPEPRRGVPRSTQATTVDEANFLPYVRSAMPFLVPFVVCLCVSAIFVAGFNGWLAPFFLRTYSWSIGEVGRILGTASLIGGLLAPVFGVFFNLLCRRWLGREAPVFAICMMLCLALPLVVGAPFLPDGRLAAVALAAVIAITGGCGIVTAVVYVSIAPRHLRARTVAILALLSGIIGSFGTVIYAGFTDAVLQDPAKLYLTLSLLSGVLIILAIIAGAIGDRRYARMVVTAMAAERAHAASYTNV
jgi:predicted MFS family arabinose efflux permease